jgi:lipopolysaccharide export LptBFGC system permease protein LptF
MGAIVAMLIVFLINLWLNPNTRAELRDSLRIPKGDHPLGEAKLEEWLEQERK